MVVNDVTPVWSNLGQTFPRGGRVPGRRMSYCPADAFEEECQNPDNPYGGSSEELFGMDNVLFPGVTRSDYAVNPLSDIGTVRIPDTESMGTVRIPDTESMGYLGQFTTPIGDYKPELWTILGSALIAWASKYAPAGFKGAVNTMALVAGGVGVASALNKLSK